MAVENARKYTFNYLPNKHFSSIDGKDLQESLIKWCMNNRLKAQAFSFDQPFQSYQKDDFVLAFFQDPDVVHSLQVVSSNGTWASHGVTASSVTVEPVPCTAMSMEYFDRLYNNNVVRESGYIVKCFDDYYEDFVISDELRKMLLIADSDNYDLYSEAERSEFLFRLFRHLCLGGAVCQYEDTVQPYLDATKVIYKDLVSVQKDSKTGQLHVTSLVYKVTALDEIGVVYPSRSRHQQNFSYFLVDPLKRHVIVFYHNFGA
jgi:hypothetical protein